MNLWLSSLVCASYYVLYVKIPVHVLVKHGKHAHVSPSVRHLSLAASTFLNKLTRFPRKVGSLSLSGNHIKKLPPDVFKSMLDLKQAGPLDLEFCDPPNLEGFFLDLVRNPYEEKYHFGNKPFSKAERLYLFGFICHSFILNQMTFEKKQQQKTNEKHMGLEEAEALLRCSLQEGVKH